MGSMGGWPRTKSQMERPPAHPRALHRQVTRTGTAGWTRWRVLLGWWTAAERPDIAVVSLPPAGVPSDNWRLIRSRAGLSFLTHSTLTAHSIPCSPIFTPFSYIETSLGNGRQLLSLLDLIKSLGLSVVSNMKNMDACSSVVPVMNTKSFTLCNAVSCRLVSI